MDQQDLGPAFNGMLIVGIVISIGFTIATMFAYVRIIQKAGYSGWNVLWMFVPIGNIVMLFVFAFAEWPITRRMREVEQNAFGPSSTVPINR